MRTFTSENAEGVHKGLCDRAICCGTNVAFKMHTLLCLPQVSKSLRKSALVRKSYLSTVVIARVLRPCHILLVRVIPQFCHQHSFFTFITTLWLIIVHISKVCILREQYIFSSVWKVNHAVRWGAFDWRVP